MLPLAAPQRLAASGDAVILPIDLQAHNPPTMMAWQRAAERQPTLREFLRFCGDQVSIGNT